MVEKVGGKVRGWHFLTTNDYDLLSTGPQKKTKRDYKGTAAARERKKWLDRYNKARRRAALHLRGALEDLSFLAQAMDREWLLEALREWRPLREPESGAGMVLSQLRRRPPFEAFLEALVGKLAWQRLARPPGQPWPQPELEPHQIPKKVPVEPVREPSGEFFIARVTEALQRGLDADPDVWAEIDVRVRPERGGYTVDSPGRVRGPPRG